jgi:hypothetical protein
MMKFEVLRPNLDSFASMLCFGASCLQLIDRYFFFIGSNSIYLFFCIKKKQKVRNLNRIKKQSGTKASFINERQTDEAKIIFQEKPKQE